MNYRIHFEPEGAYWCIQFLRFFTYWKTVKALEVSGNGTTSTLKILKFENLNEAIAYVQEVGIDAAYHRSQTRTLAGAVQANPTGESSIASMTLSCGEFSSSPRPEAA